VVIAYQLGTWVYIKTNGKLHYLVISAQVILLVFQCWTGYHQISSTSKYAYAVDERMKLINRKLENGISFIELDPLPDSGWLFTSEITNDTTHFRNKHLSLYLGTDSKLVLRKPEVSSSQ
jgi:hypothetical protein